MTEALVHCAACRSPVILFGDEERRVFEMTTKERYEMMKNCGRKKTKDLRIPSFIALALIAAIIASRGIMEAYLTLLLVLLVAIVYLIGEKC